MTPPTPTELTQVRAVDLVSELLRRGISIDELCGHAGVSNVDELGSVLGGVDVNQWGAR